jgi:activating signal cointegrator complex subunit 2
MVCDEVDEDNMYQDEYDDSYDAMADSESKTTKALLSTEIDEDSEEIESDEEEKKSTNIGSGGNKDFCENPEVIRARYEKARQTKLNVRSSGNKEFQNK